MPAFLLFRLLHFLLRPITVTSNNVVLQRLVLLILEAQWLSFVIHEFYAQLAISAILLASGRDTFSKITLDKIYQKVKTTPDITIFAISTGGALRAMTEGGPGMGAQMRDIDYLQADNEMKTFAKMTGGMWFEPRFVGEMPDIFADINKAIRSKYELVYHPSDAKQDGTYRKLRVELVDDEGKPLRFQDEKHKPLKYEVIARDGYRAKQEVE